MKRQFHKLEVLVDGKWVEDSCTYPSKIAAVFDAFLRGWKREDFRAVPVQ